jgi:hypothetical protein
MPVYGIDKSIHYVIGENDIDIVLIYQYIT